MAMTTDLNDMATMANEVVLEAEEVEEMIAPGINLQHNETLASDEVELNVEEMEEVIAPAIASNHNETLIKQ